MTVFEAVVNNLDEAVFLFDRKGTLMFVNKAGEEFIGRSLKEIAHRQAKELFAGAKDIVLSLQKTIKEGRVFNSRDMEIDMGRPATINLNISPFYLDGNLEGALLCIRENLSLTNREDYHFDTLLYLIGSIAHEIKNPLSGIKGAAQILRGNAHSPESMECVNLILKEADRLNHVLQSYLTMTRMPVFNRLNIHEVIEHALKVMGTTIQEKGISVEKSYDPSLPYLRGDESKLLQVFINILKNAVEAIAAKGGRALKGQKGKAISSSRARGEQHPPAVLSVSTRPSNEYMVIYEGVGSREAQSKSIKQRWVVIAIEDSGIGVPREDIDKIFLPFYTKKEGGSGLGLALSKKIIKDHGGIIKVNSKIGQGATVSVYLPIQVAPEGE